MTKALIVGVILSIGVLNPTAYASKPQTPGSGYATFTDDTASAWPEAVTQSKVDAAEHQKLEELNKNPATPPIEREKNAAAQAAIVARLDRNAEKFVDNKVVQSAAAGAAIKENQPEKAQVYASRWERLAKPDSAEWAAAVKMGALAASKAGDFPKAEAAALRVLEKFPKDKDALGLYHMAKGRAKAGATTTAEPARAAPATTRAADPYLKEGQTALQVKNLQRAVAEADKYLKLRDREGALHAAQNAAAIDAATGFQLQARILAVFKEFSQALDSITKAIEALSGHPDRQASAYAQRAAIRNSKDDPQRDPAEALKDANAALALDPNSARALLERGKAKKGLGDPTADADLQGALDRAPALKAELEDFLSAGPASEPHRIAAPSLPLVPIGLGALFIAIAAALFFKKASSPAKTLDNGRYVIGRVLGQGGMGVVYEAKDTQLGRLVAVKSLNKDLQAQAGECLRFVGEAQAVAALQHPHIVQVFTIIEEPESTSIVFERIDGGTLHDVIRRAAGGMPKIQALEYARQIASALDYAHAHRVIHRDLKPSNVMVTQVDGKDWLKVMDFGIAKQVDGTSPAMTASIIGTPAYMAPEQKHGVVTKQSDQYALAVTIREMLPQSADAVFKKALDPDPAQRYPSCMDFCRALEAAL